MLYYPSKLIVPSRANIAIQTPWLAPIVWDRTFQIGILNQQFWLQNVSIGLVVFTTGACIAFLKVLLQTSETYFMQGHRVKYYPFNGQPASLPTLKPCKGRQMLCVQSGDDQPSFPASLCEGGGLPGLCLCEHHLLPHCGCEGPVLPVWHTASSRLWTPEKILGLWKAASATSLHFWGWGSLLWGKGTGDLQAHQVPLPGCDDGPSSLHRSDESYLNCLLYHKPTKVLSPGCVQHKQLMGKCLWESATIPGLTLTKTPERPQTASVAGMSSLFECCPRSWPRFTSVSMGFTFPMDWEKTLLGSPGLVHFKLLW